MHKCWRLHAILTHMAAKSHSFSTLFISLKGPLAKYGCIPASVIVIEGNRRH
jgi:hypothetical protein